MQLVGPITFRWTTTRGVERPRRLLRVTGYLSRSMFINATTTTHELPDFTQKDTAEGRAWKEAHLIALAEGLVPLQAEHSKPTQPAPQQRALECPHQHRVDDMGNQAVAVGSLEFCARLEQGFDLPDAVQELPVPRMTCEDLRRGLRVERLLGGRAVLLDIVVSICICVRAAMPNAAVRVGAAGVAAVISTILRCAFWPPWLRPLQPPQRSLRADSILLKVVEQDLCIMIGGCR